MRPLGRGRGVAARPIVRDFELRRNRTGATGSDPASVPLCREHILVAEVQSRCGSLLAAADATTHEERMTRQSARLTLQLAEALRKSESQERLLQALADSKPSGRAENWANRAAIVWCAEPEVS